MANYSSSLRCAKNLINKYVPDYKLISSSGLKNFGECFTDKKHILINKSVLELNEWIIVKTLTLHEIAHALDIKRNYLQVKKKGWKGHGKGWKLIMRELGEDPNKCDCNIKVSGEYFCSCICGHNNFIGAKKNYKGKCHSCKRVLKKSNIIKW